ncbi:hypothetical protein C7C45_08850 [Micromonospora arborensis]|uniref:DNA methylase N-4/N-6 domain-containing protein n=1 Tax=Micromonospora arborensis TaxID=2116518 RepID=A0A318NN68_9ACTN|nr:DNA methyltransferase [Micromonospora arborensis]PYC72534.1 hypothetical protein C7C45_08850 [Micromonospora arborensis]
MTSLESSSLFAKWTEERHLPSLGTNDGAPPIAFQRWHRFKEAFPPELIEKAVSQSSIRVNSCVDPFGGSGTTALACQMLGIDSVTVEVNPFLADVIRAKLTRYDLDLLIAALAEVRRNALKRQTDPLEYFGNVPATFLERAGSSRWLFNRDIAENLAAILVSIEGLEYPDARRLFRVVTGGLLAEVSNVTVSGKGRRYRRNWAAASPVPEQVHNAFSERAERAIRDIQRFAERPKTSWAVMQGDARKVQPEGPFDLAVFSPPYPNSFDYTDVYNLELWMLGYLQAGDDNRVLRTSTLASHVQLMRDYPEMPPGSPTLVAVVGALEHVKKSLWNQWIPKMIGGYFADLLVVVRRVMSQMASGAQCWVVIGDSRYAGVNVPAGRILVELADAEGWTVKGSDPIRHMKSSAQQGWRPELAESLVVLQKA